MKAYTNATFTMLREMDVHNLKWHAATFKQCHTSNKLPPSPVPHPRDGRTYQRDHLGSGRDLVGDQQLVDGHSEQHGHLLATPPRPIPHSPPPVPHPRGERTYQRDHLWRGRDRVGDQQLVDGHGEQHGHPERHLLAGLCRQAEDEGTKDRELDARQNQVERVEHRLSAQHDRVIDVDVRLRTTRVVLYVPGEKTKKVLWNENILLSFRNSAVAPTTPIALWLY